MNTDKFSAALDYARMKHASQVRKGTNIPYITHPLAVAGLVLEHGGDWAQATAALLHDVPEDQGGKEALDEIRRYFSDDVATIVEHCSDFIGLPGEPKPPVLERKAAWLARLPLMPTRSLLVILCDKVHNAECIARDFDSEGDAVFKRFKAGKGAVCDYYKSLLRFFMGRAPNARELNQHALERRLLLACDTFRDSASSLYRA